jgi:uncharacterized protein YdhG (YjbR/CyaY superfamily)
MMRNTGTPPTTIDGYIAGCPAAVQPSLRKLRDLIHAAAPGAGERIAYGMPTFTCDAVLVHFAAFPKHVGFYPTPSGIENFRDRLADYVVGKGSIQFPLDRPIPYTLVRDIVRFRVAENRARSGTKPAGQPASKAARAAKPSPAAKTTRPAPAPRRGKRGSPRSSG